MSRWSSAVVVFVVMLLFGPAAGAQTFWTGGVNTQWDMATHNWVSGSPLVGAAYVDGSAVQFGDTNPVTGGVVANVGGTAAIAIQSMGVSPASVEFTNAGPGADGVNYLIGGGPILGATGLTLSGTDGIGGSVSLSSANGFSGPVSVQVGQLNLLGGLALGNTSGVTIATGATLGLQSSSGAVVFGQTASGSNPIPLSLAGSGLSGGGALVNLSGNNFYAGPIAVGATSGGATISSTASSPGDSLTLTGGISVAPGAQLVLAGSGPTLISSGGLSLAASTGAGSAALTVGGPGTTEIDSPPTWDAGSSLGVTGGVLRFNLNAGSATIGSGVTASVSAGGTLELAGSVSALATPASRISVVNNSTASGLMVTGAGQRVGGIDGAGDVHVAAGADLTADHIIQDALVIGGTATTSGLVTIAASDPGGSSLAASGLSFETPPQQARGFAGNALGSSTSLSATQPFSSLAVSDSAAVGAALPRSSGGLSVPEPSSLALVLGVLVSIAAYISFRSKVCERYRLASVGHRQ